jgi:NAD(P)-dependent dehydrogenase (short-subunit alcohol dehydrogenase family)
MGARRQSFGDVDTEAVLNLIHVNALAPLKLAEALADNVAKSDRKVMAFQTSLMGSIEDNGSGGAYAYRLSKAALNMVGKSVANDLRGRGVIAVLLHPGWVRTRMGGPSGKISVEECVEGQQRILDALTPEQSGRFFNYDGRELPW